MAETKLQFPAGVSFRKRDGVEKYDDSEARDENGRWTDSGSSGAPINQNRARDAHVDSFSSKSPAEMKAHLQTAHDDYMKRRTGPERSEVLSSKGNMVGAHADAHPVDLRSGHYKPFGAGSGARDTAKMSPQQLKAHMNEFHHSVPSASTGSAADRHAAAHAMGYVNGEIHSHNHAGTFPDIKGYWKPPVG